MIFFSIYLCPAKSIECYTKVISSKAKKYKNSKVHPAEFRKLRRDDFETNGNEYRYYLITTRGHDIEGFFGIKKFEI